MKSLLIEQPQEVYNQTEKRIKRVFISTPSFKSINKKNPILWKNYIRTGDDSIEISSSTNKHLLGQMLNHVERYIRVHNWKGKSKLALRIPSEIDLIHVAILESLFKRHFNRVRSFELQLESSRDRLYGLMIYPDQTGLARGKYNGKSIGGLSEAMILRICSNLPKLKKIKFKFARNFNFTNEGLKCVACHLGSFLKNLNDLSVQFDSQDCINENGLEKFGYHLGKSLRKLKQLELTFPQFKGASPKGFKTITHHIAYYMKNLLSLKLNFLKYLGFDDDLFGFIMSQISKYMTNLQYFHLGILEACLRGLEFKLDGYLPSLKNISLGITECRSFENEALLKITAEISKSFPNLTHFRIFLSNCDKVSDKGLELLGNEFIKHLPGLQELNLNFYDCKYVSDKALDNLRQKLTFIPKVSIV